MNGQSNPSSVSEYTDVEILHSFTKLLFLLLGSHEDKKGKTAFLRQTKRTDDYFIACRVAVKTKWQTTQ